jgi:uncharacterized protein
MSAALTAILPPEIQGWVVLALMTASFVGSFITISFGLGGGIFFLAVLATLVPPAALIPVHGLVQLGSNSGRVANLLRHVAWRYAGWFTLGTLAGVFAGGSVAVALTGPWVKLGIGLFVLYSVFGRPPAWLTRWPLATGAIASVLTMFFGATGPFVAVYTKSLPLDRHGYTATQAALMAQQHLLKCIAFGFFGFAFGPWLGLCLLLILAGFAGTLAGRLVLNRLTDLRFRRALDAVLVLIALELVWSGLHGLIWPAG